MVKSAHNEAFCLSVHSPGRWGGRWAAWLVRNRFYPFLLPRPQRLRIRQSSSRWMPRAADETFCCAGAGGPVGGDLTNLCEAESQMLYSQSMNVGFAHYPKTAGHSLTRWFREVFPDARLVEPHPRYDVNHLPVRDSLEKLGLVQQRDRSLVGCHRLTRACVKLARRLGRWLPAGHDGFGFAGKPCATRIIGVVREPFEMLVSLFEYWRSYDFTEESAQPLIQTARRGDFRRFLALAVGDAGLANYESFFDMHGPASANTRLLDFNSLEPALLQVCREFGLNAPDGRLGILNVGPSRQRDLQHYRTEAGTLLAEVRSHFRWYYDEGVHLMVKGSATATAVDRHRPLHSRGASDEGDPRAYASRWTFPSLAGQSDRAAPVANG